MKSLASTMVIVEKPRPQLLAIQRLDRIAVGNAPQTVQRLVSGVTIIAGLPNSGKSAMALDLAMSISAHTPWFGRKVSGGPVLYLPAEGASGLLVRAKATLRRKWAGHLPPLYIGNEVPPLGSEAGSEAATDRLIATVEEIGSLEGEAVSMVVVDTIAAVLAGADENGAGMTSLARAAHRIHTETGAAVVMLHHPGKSDGNALRGHSSLSGAADVILAVEADPITKVRSVRVSKARDFATGDAIHFELEAVELEERDCFGDPQSTVIVKPTDQQPVQQIKGAGKNQGTALVALREWARANPAAGHVSSIDLGALLKVQGISAKRKPEALNWMVNAGVITPSIGGYTVNRGQL